MPLLTKTIAAPMLVFLTLGYRAEQPPSSLSPAPKSGDTPPATEGAKEKPAQPLATHKNSVGMTLVRLPQQEVLIGSDDPSAPSLRFKVTFTPTLWVSDAETTQSQWKSLMDSNPSKVVGDDLPVTNITWDEATDFCKKLSTREKETYRLLTEAEWEYACRAGTTTAYSFGNSAATLGEYAWYNANSGGRVHSVRGKKPNPWMLYDMHGNVREWCSDWFVDPYPYTKGMALVDPDGGSPQQAAKTGKKLFESAMRSVRGGDYSGLSAFALSGMRDSGNPAYRLDYYGFRVVRVIKDAKTDGTQLPQDATK
ncbi:MAG: formylglycine-generating enzyme family protein [Phycisphaerales bacterium]